MATSLSSPSADNQIWHSLRQAIAESSGFKRWKHDRNLEGLGQDLDLLVHRYLRETLETLAY
jgi:hypothetical protein